MATTRPGRSRPVRARTRRRELQRWGQRHAQVIDELNAALAALTGSAGAIVGVGDLVSLQRATSDAERLVAAVNAAQELPAPPDAAASFARVLELWLAGGTLQLAALRAPFDADESARAADLLAQGVDEFVRFAQSFVAEVA